MAGTPEVLKPGQPEVQGPVKESEFIVPETEPQSTGGQVVQKNFKTQVNDPIVQPQAQTTPPPVVTIQPPADNPTLEGWSKGSVSSSQTWLGAFWIRIVKKALLFGWRILGKGDTNAA